MYQAFFAEIVRQCGQAGLIRGDTLYVDSTLVRANAALSSVGSRTLITQLARARADDHVVALWRDNPEDVAESDSSPAAPVPTPAGVVTSTGPRAIGPGDLPNGLPGCANALAMSRTDPDAGLVGRKQVPLALYHKVHVGVDAGRARIITAVDATPGEVLDEDLLVCLAKEHEGATGATLAEVVADTKYGTYEHYRWLEAQRIRASIPPHLGGGKQRAMPGRCSRTTLPRTASCARRDRSCIGKGGR